MGGLANDKKQRLKKLKTAKYNPVKGIATELFTIANENLPPQPLTVQYQLAPLVPRLLLQASLDLFEENMATLYQHSSWGLNLKAKREELDHRDARFLLVSDNAQSLLGYCHFRFDVDDDDEPEDIVVYVYELQISSTVQGCGIGRRLMEIVHQIAVTAGISKTMLTCFKENKSAVEFYKKLGYKVDEISPIGEDFEIMSYVES